jgi:hypothetical protein
VVVQAVPQVPVNSGPQNNPGALQGPNTPTVVATNPTVMAVPSLPVVVNNPPVVAQPPAQQPGPVVVQAVPQVPVNSGPQNNPGALQGPNTPTVVATNPTAVAVPTLPVVVSNPPVVAQPPAQQPGPVVVQAVPQVPVSSGPQHNPGALQAPVATTVVTQPVTPAVPSLPPQTGPVVTGVAVPGPQPNRTPTVIVGPDAPPMNFVNPPTTGPGPGGTPGQTTVVTVNPPTTLPIGQITPGGDGPTGPNGPTPTTGTTQQPPVQNPTFEPGGQGGSQGAHLRRVAARGLRPATPAEREATGLRYSVIYRNYEAQTLVNDIGRPLYALASGYEFFLQLEGRSVQSIEPVSLVPAKAGR